MTDAASVWTARCERLLPAGPAAILQPAAAAPAPAPAGAVPALPVPAAVPAAAGELSSCPPSLALAARSGPLSRFSSWWEKYRFEKMQNYNLL